MTVFYSCKKSVDKPLEAILPATEKVTVGLALNGDIDISETSLTGGRLRGLSNYVSARTVYDSTIYAVKVRSSDGRTYALGLFDRPYDISLSLLSKASYQIYVTAIKKGTSQGFWRDLRSDGYQYFYVPSPFPLRNQMTYDSAGSLPYNFLDTLQYLAVRKDTLQGIEFSQFPHLDSYYGSANYNTGDSSATLLLPLKRVSFGLKYRVTNLTEGFLIAKYDDVIKDKTIYASNLDSLNIYTADAFRWRDSLYYQGIHLTLLWQKNTGTVVVGDKYLSPKRNSLTTINVTLPTGSNSTTGVGVVLTDTEFTSGNQIDF
jgi:hypothetical protein